LSFGTSQGSRQAIERPRTPLWLWLLLIGGFGLIFWLYVPNRAGPNPPPAAVDPPLIWVSILVPVVVIGILSSLAVQWLRRFDPVVQSAEKRASEGDLDGAIAELREHIEEKGSTQTRVNALGILLMRRERWEEAAAMFRKGEQIGEFNKGICRANLGLALFKAGKPAEAIPVLQEAARIGPQVLPLTCIIDLHLSLALAELNRWDEAEEQFRRAEGAAPRLRKAQRDVLNEELERCRQKLEQHSREQAKAEGLAESPPATS
jgi:tetratricopeptide (TPR) repeat protein